MPEITNPQVVSFSNNKVRPLADRLYQAYFLAKSVIQDYNDGDLGTKINAAGAGNLITDGSEIDGRSRMVGGDIFNFITALQEFVDFYEGGVVTQADRSSVIGKPHVN